MKRILIIHTWGIGDWLFFSPTFEQLRKTYPDFQFDLILGSPATLSIAKLYSGISQIYTFDVRKEPWKIAQIAWRWRAHKYHSVVFTAGPSSRKIDLTAALFRAEHKVALQTSVHPTFFLTASAPLNPELHMVENNLKLLELLHVPAPKDIFPQIPLPAVAKTNTIVIHPGCDQKNAYRRWPVEYFAQLSEQLLQQGHPVEIILGPDELELEKAFDSLKAHPAFQIVKNLSLPEVYKKIAAARLFINSDSGLGHIAAALARPVLTIMGPADARATRPYSANSVVLEPTLVLNCRPCVGPGGLHGCAERPCLYSISVERVHREINEFLSLRSL